MDSRILGMYYSDIDLYFNIAHILATSHVYEAN